ncbi:FixH family protein [Bacillaceae bacterium S4-13-56]
MKQWLGVIVLFFSITVAGCGNSSDQGNSNGEDHEGVPQRLEVELTVPESVRMNEDILVEAHVTQGDEAVNDASEVKFEVKNVETEKSQSFEGEFVENGKYSATIQIEEPGTYTVTSHVTARGLHTMPSKELVVEGDKGQSESEEPKTAE